MVIFFSSRPVNIGEWFFGLAHWDRWFPSGIQAELEESLGRLQSFCRPGGRAQLGCNVQTISYTNGPRDKKVFEHLNHFILQAASCGKLQQVGGVLSSWFFMLFRWPSINCSDRPNRLLGCVSSTFLSLWRAIFQAYFSQAQHTKGIKGIIQHHATMWAVLTWTSLKFQHQWFYEPHLSRQSLRCRAFDNILYRQRVALLLHLLRHGPKAPWTIRRWT